MTLESLRNLAGTDKSTGYLVDNNGQLEKLDAHRHLKGLNTHPQANDVSNRWAREDVFTKLRDSLASHSHGRLTQSQKSFLQMAARELGVALRDGFTVDSEHTIDTPLARSTVRALLKGHDFIVGGERINPGKTDNSTLYRLINMMKDSFENIHGRQQMREVLGKILRAKLGDGFDLRQYSTVRTVFLRRLTEAVLTGHITTLEQLREQAALGRNVSKINTEEMIDMAERFEQSREEEKALVKMIGHEAVHGPVQANAQPQAPQVEAPKKPEGGFFANLMANLQGAKKAIDENSKPATDAQLRSIEKMLADIVYDEDTLEADRNSGNPGQMLAFSLEKNVEGLALLLTKGDQLIGERNHPDPLNPDADQGWKTPPQLNGVARDIAQEILDAGLELLLDQYAGSENADQREIARRIDLVRNPKSQAELATLTDVECDQYLSDFSKGLNDLKTVRSLARMGLRKQFGLGVTNTDTLAQVKEKLLAKLHDPDFVSEVLSQIPERMNEAIEAQFAAAQTQIQTAFAEIVGIGGGQLEQFVRGEKNLVEQLQQHGMWRDNPPPFEVDEIPDPPKRDERGAPYTANEYAQLVEQVKERRAQRLANIVKASRELLDKMMKDTGFSPDRGYGKFMTLAMGSYFTGMSTLDKRSMLSAGIRYAKPEVTVPENADADARNAAERKNKANMLGAFFKGAGPLMQKMLQGLASVQMGPEAQDFKDAIEDMKSHLAPISEKFVRATLLDMVKRSNGRVASIDVKESLGAASVGEAFLCTVHLARPDAQGRNQIEAVVKILRPDAEQRLEREKKIFLDAADQTEGMKVTFDGQLQSIVEELDLRKEAANTVEGQLYDRGAGDVKSMKLMNLIAPTKYSMVIEKAPGVTVDRLFKNIDSEVKDIVDGFVESVTTVPQAGHEAVPVTDVNKYFSEGTQLVPKTWEVGADFVNKSTQALEKLTRLYQETKIQQERLISLSQKWCAEGIYVSGFYHGDLHAGNIMVDNAFERDANDNIITGANGNKGLTVIDFGNATKLSADQQEQVIRMMSAAAVKDTNRFLDGFYNLMSEGGKAAFRRNRKVIHDMVHNVFNLGTSADAGKRIAIVLSNLQTMGHELPAPIFKFSQCQIRLQGTVDEMNAKLELIAKAMYHITRTENMFNSQDKTDAMHIAAKSLSERIFENSPTHRHDNFVKVRNLLLNEMESRRKRHPEMTRALNEFVVVDEVLDNGTIKESIHAPLGDPMGPMGELGEDDRGLLAGRNYWGTTRNDMLNGLLWSGDVSAMNQLADRLIAQNSPLSDQIRQAKQRMQAQYDTHFKPAFDHERQVGRDIDSYQNRVEQSPEGKAIAARISQFQTVKTNAHFYTQYKALLNCYPNGDPEGIANFFAQLGQDLADWTENGESYADIDEYIAERMPNANDAQKLQFKNKIAAYELLTTARYHKKPDGSAFERFNMEQVESYVEYLLGSTRQQFLAQFEALMPGRAGMFDSGDREMVTEQFQQAETEILQEKTRLSQVPEALEQRRQQAQAALDAQREPMLRAAAELADLLELCTLQELQKVTIDMEKCEKRLPLANTNGQLADPQDFCDALGDIIQSNQKATLDKMGVWTVIEYKLTGKLSGDKPQVPRI